MKYLLIYPHIGILILAWFLTDLFVPIIRSLAWHFKILDKPSERKVHHAPVPRLGGFAVYLAFLLALLSTLEFHQTLLLILTGGAIIVIVGVIDDIWGVPAIIKLVFLIAVVEFLARHGLVLHIFPSIPILNELITIFWVVFIVSSFNAVDNMNGLSCGITLIAALFIFGVAWEEWQRWLSFVAMALIGSSLGFLRYNFPKATIFLGDSGSFFLGFILAEMAVIGEWSQTPLKGILVPSLVLGLPIFDLGITICFRYTSGVICSVYDAVTMSAKDHSSHRLLALGFSETSVVCILWGAAIVFGISGVLVKWLPFWGGFGVCIVILIGIVWFALFLYKAEKLIREEKLYKEHKTK